MSSTKGTSQGEVFFLLCMFLCVTKEQATPTRHGERRQKRAHSRAVGHQACEVPILACVVRWGWQRSQGSSRGCVCARSLHARHHNSGARARDAHPPIPASHKPRMLQPPRGGGGGGAARRGASSEARPPLPLLALGQLEVLLDQLCNLGALVGRNVGVGRRGQPLALERLDHLRHGGK